MHGCENAFKNHNVTIIENCNVVKKISSSNQIYLNSGSAVLEDIINYAQNFGRECTVRWALILIRVL